MKKSIVIVLLLAGTASFAQHFDLGIKGGLNISNFNGNSNSSLNDIKAKTLIGFHAGLFLGLYLGDNFSIQPEALISTQGAKIDNGTTKDDYKLTYIAVPVMVKYRFNGGFYLEAGPQIGFNVHSSVAGNSEDFAKNTDLAVAGGLGYSSKIGLGIGARYVASLSKVGNFDASTTTPDYRNGNIQVSLFYTLFNGHKK